MNKDLLRHGIPGHARATFVISAMKAIYLDYNATTPPLPEVVDAMSHHFQHSFANPGSRHAEGRRARQALEQARESIASILGADPHEVIFTSGGTESTNLAIFGLTQRSPGTIALTRGAGVGGRSRWWRGVRRG